MSVSVVHDKSSRTGNSATVVIEGPSIDDVTGADAKNLALSHAMTLGLSRPGLGIGGGAYYVNAAGEPALQVGEGGKYRYDYTVSGGR